MYLLMFAALYLSAYHLGNLLFQVINLAFPDPLSPFETAAAGQRIRWATSTLIVAFPVFLFVASRISRDIAGSLRGATPRFEDGSRTSLCSSPPRSSSATRSCSSSTC